MGSVTAYDVPMNVLVCGSRDWEDRALLDSTLDALLAKLGPFEVIEGEAKGADTMAREWAERKRLPVQKFPADWAKLGKAAGPVRNVQMLAEGKPDLVVAFQTPGGSKGTSHMVAIARHRNVDVRVVTATGMVMAGG